MKPINSAFIFVLLLSLSLLTFTVYKSNQTPVQHENLFSTDYKTVGRNYNTIKENEKIFNENASFSYKYINDKITIKINSKNGDKLEVGSIKALLTRPHTNKNNEELEVFMGDIISIKIPKLSLGLWRVNLQMNIKLKEKNIVLYKHIPIRKQ